jgi:hypothetical protein
MSAGEGQGKMPANCRMEAPQIFSSRLQGQQGTGSIALLPACSTVGGWDSSSQGLAAQMPLRSMSDRMLRRLSRG